MNIVESAMSKPQPIAPNTQKFPPELTCQPNWVVWRYLPPTREGAKYRKVPYQPNGKPASTTDRTTWSSFDACRNAYASGGYDGLGYVFDGEVGEDGFCYVGVDFDSCILDSEGRQQVHSVALERIKRLETYTERSVSGTGFHCIARAKPLDSAAIYGGVEVYCIARYFTFTGHGFGVIRTAPFEIDALVKEVREQKAASGCIEETTARATPASTSNSEASRWFDDLSEAQKDEVVDHALGVLARETKLFELQANGGNNYTYLTLALATVRSGAPHAEDIFVKYASAAVDADTSDALREFLARCRNADGRQDRGTGIGTLLYLAVQHGADFSQWRDQLADDVVRYFPGNEQVCRDALDRIVASDDLVFTLDGGPLVILRVPNDRSLPKEASWGGDLPATTLATAADVMERAEKLPWMYRQGGKGGERWRRGSPPRQFVADYLVQMRSKYGARRLTGICRVPRIDDQGQVHFVSGYDPETGLYHDQTPAFSLPPAPTIADARAAADKLLAPFKHYVFEDAVAGRATLLGMILTALQRPFLPTAPMFAVRASMPGVGKGLLVRSTAYLAYNSLPVIATWGHNDEEFAKRLDALLIQSPAMISIDNANGRLLQGDALEAILSEGVADVRPLGRSETIRVRNRSFIVVTGNNLIVTGDMARRALVVDLLPKSQSPERDTYPFNPAEIVRQHRPELLQAAFTIMRAHRLAAPSQNLPGIGSFELWARRVRDPIEWLFGYDISNGFQQNKEEDPRRQEDAALLAALYNNYGTAAFRSADVHAIYSKVSNFKRLPYVTKPTQVEEELHAAIEGAIGAKDITAKRIGQWAKRVDGAFIENYKLDVRMNRASNSNELRVTRT
jgi:putative DNA primase/helicase